MLHYCPETGAFTWKVTASNRRKAGERAGCLCKDTGYNIIGLNGRVQKASRLAWLYVYGEWPVDMIDHINGIRNDDRIENLRCATHAQNLRNRGKQRNNSSGFKGVYRHKNAWRARINVDGRTVSLGLFPNPEEAHQAYAQASVRYHGDFARAK